MATPTPAELANLPPQDATNAAKYDTPLPPLDPASQRGARDNPLYIGPTNFSTLQQTYTPYQIEQATTRNASGDIFYKQGVDITKVPAAPPGASTTDLTKTTSGGTTPTSSTLTNTGSLNTSAVTAPPADATALAKAQSAAAKTSLDGINLIRDNLYSVQQDLLTQAKDQAQAKVDADRAGIAGFETQDARQKALENDRKLFNVQANIQTLDQIRQQIATAKSALDQGIIYEEAKPIRMQLLTGRVSELYKQGVSKINALNAAAQVVQGNLDLANAYMRQTQDAIDKDVNDQKFALSTLLELDSNSLITLTKDEKDVIDRRMGLLDDQATLEKDKAAQVLDLAKTAPNAFVSGGVTFSDTVESALQKMLPFMSERDKLEFEAGLAAKNRSNRGSGGSGSGVGATGPNLTIDDVAKTLKTVSQQNAYQDTLDALAKLDSPQAQLDYLKSHESQIVIGSSRAAYDYLVQQAEASGASTQELPDTIQGYKDFFQGNATTDIIDTLITNRDAIIEKIGKSGYGELISYYQNVAQQESNQASINEQGVTNFFSDLNKPVPSVIPSANEKPGLLKKGIDLVSNIFKK